MAAGRMASSPTAYRQGIDSRSNFGVSTTEPYIECTHKVSNFAACWMPANSLPKSPVTSYARCFRCNSGGNQGTFSRQAYSNLRFGALASSHWTDIMCAIAASSVP